MAEWFDLKLELSEKQVTAWEVLMNDTTSEVWYWGAAWWGKSYLGVMWVWTMANKYPWTRWFFWRKELTNLKKTTLNSYYKFLQDYKIPKQNKGKLNSKDNFITFENGSEILLLDCAYKPTDPLYTRFWSLELTGWFIDESNEIWEWAIAILNTRVGRQRNHDYGIKPKILETFNPDKWHIYRRFYKPWKELGKSTLFEVSNSMGTKISRAFIPALVTDNPKVDPNYIVQLKQVADNITRQRLLLWNFDYDDTAGKLFRYDEIIDLFRNEIWTTEYIDAISQRRMWNVPWFISCDVARLWEDATRIGVWKGLELMKIESLIKQPTDIVADKVKELETEFKVQRSHIVVDSDGVWWWVADQLRGCINFVNAATPFKTYSERNSDYFRKNFGNLKTQCYFKLKELMEKRKIRVHSEGMVKDKIANELDNILVKDENRDGKILLESKQDLKVRLWWSPDYADMIMMRMIWVVREEENNTPEENLWVFETNREWVLY